MSTLNNVYMRPGYYLVRNSDKERFFISEKINPYALEKVCNKLLSDSTGYGYWIDYLRGLDVKGCLHWCNHDHKDYFLD